MTPRQQPGRERVLALWVALTVTLGVSAAQLALAPTGSTGLASGSAAALVAAIGLAALAGLSAGQVAQVLAQRLAQRHRQVAPVRVRARTAYLDVAAPADPDRPGQVRSRAPGRQCP